MKSFLKIFNMEKKIKKLKNSNEAIFFIIKINLKLFK